MGMSDSYTIKRFGQALFTIFAAVSFTFVLIHMLPGGPVQYVKARLAQSGTSLSNEELKRLAEAYVGVRPDEPLYIQYIDYVSSAVFHIDLGRSFLYDQPVAEILAQALPWTIFVMASALFINFALSVVIGALMAYKQGSKFDFGMSIILQSAASVPYFIAALFFLYVFSFQMGWFPTGGRVGSVNEFSVNFVISVLHHAALPILSLVITQLGNALLMRANSISVLGNDFVQVARLRGLSEGRISVFYVAHNAILPLYTFFLILVGYVFGGSVILETIFSYYGIGYIMFKAIKVRDYPLMMGAFLLITIAVTIGILIADLTYGYIDPRVSREGSS